MLYTRLLGRPEVPLATRLGTVGPRGSGSTAQAPAPVAAPVAVAN